MIDRRHTVASLALVAIAGSASAELLLEVDLTVIDQITITATDGAAGASASGSTFTGFYLASFFNDASLSGIINGTGSLTAASVASDGSPSLYSSGSSFGLNIWSYSSTGDTTFTAGETAFSGSGTWTLSSSQYALFLSGNTFGDIYFAADTDDDLPGATVIGQWSVVPAPGAIALLGHAGSGGRRRRD